MGDYLYVLHCRGPMHALYNNPILIVMFTELCAFCFLPKLFSKINIQCTNHIAAVYQSFLLALCFQNGLQATHIHIPP